MAKLRGVNFTLPPGCYSDAYNLENPPFIIDQSVPFDPSDASTLTKRYGKAKDGNVPDVQGLHTPDNEADLTDVWALNPSFFRDHDLYDGVPTQQEIYDAHYTQVHGPGKLVHDEAFRLRTQGNTVPPPNPTPTPDPTPTPTPTPSPVVAQVPPQLIELLHDAYDNAPKVLNLKGLTYLGTARRAVIAEMDVALTHAIQFLESIKGVVLD